MKLLFILYDPLEHILHHQALKRTQMSYIPQLFRIFSEHPKNRTLRQYNFVNSFNVKTGFKCYKLLQGTTCEWKMQNIQQTFVLHAFKSDDEMRNELS